MLDVDAPAGATGFAARLTAVLDLQGRGYTNVRFFAALTERLAGTGITYRSSKVVTEWTRGRAEPPLAVVEAMAAVLGVPAGWLAFGHSEPPAPVPLADVSVAREEARQLE